MTDMRPFNPATIIRFSLPESAHVTLEVFTVNGENIAVPLNETRSFGSHAVTFDASNFSSGIYICHLKSGNYV